MNVKPSKEKKRFQPWTNVLPFYQWSVYDINISTICFSRFHFLWSPLELHRVHLLGMTYFRSRLFNEVWLLWNKKNNRPTSKYSVTGFRFEAKPTFHPFMLSIINRERLLVCFWNFTLDHFPTAFLQIYNLSPPEKKESWRYRCDLKNVFQ